MREFAQKEKKPAQSNKPPQNGGNRKPSPPPKAQQSLPVKAKTPTTSTKVPSPISGIPNKNISRSINTRIQPMINRQKANNTAIINRVPAQVSNRNSPSPQIPHIAPVIQPVTTANPITIQTFSQVSSPSDPSEKEASSVAQRVMRMSIPESSIIKTRSSGGNSVYRYRSTDTKDNGISAFRGLNISRLLNATAQNTLQYHGGGAAAVSPNIFSSIRGSMSGGAPLPENTRRFMEPRFQADFSNVRVHTGDNPDQFNRQLSSHAFTVGNHIFFGRDKFRPATPEGQELIAHELTHTIQQGAVVRRSEAIPISQSSPAVIQRSEDEDNGKILNWFADKANIIPGFRMFTIIIGRNPINMARVDPSPANILRALIEFMPGGGLITQALDNYGIIDKIAVWIVGKIKALGMVANTFISAIKQFVKSIGAADILAFWKWGDLWDRAKGIFTAPIDNLISFAEGVVTDIVAAVKDYILKPIAVYAKDNTDGYPLLCTIMGKDPISGEAVPQDAAAFMGSFLKFIGEEETWEKMKKANALPRAMAWFNNALKTLKGFASEIPGLFTAAFKALEIIDIILIPKAFVKLAKVFGNFAGRFVSWGLTAIWNLLEIIFDAFKPGVMGYIKKTGAALKSILKNPIPFVGNLVKAAKLGFSNFADNFGQHFKRGLLDWLVGSLNGVYIPKALSLLELGKFALSVMGITWAGIRTKIVKALGPKGEEIMGGIEKGAEWVGKGFEIVKKLATGGIAAAWEMIQEKLTELKDSVISGITGFVIDTIIQKAVPKLIAMFIPGAGFIPAIISIYDTIMVFVQKISKIIQVVVAFIDSIVAIAGGNISAAAKRVEAILGGLLSLAISFLAGFLGLNKITDKINDVIRKLRDKVDKAIDAALAWIVNKAKELFKKLFGKKDKKDTRTEAEKTRDKQKGIADAEKLVSKKGFDEKKIRSKLGAIKKRYKLLTLDLVVDSKDDKKETIHFTASASTVVPGNPITVEIGDWPVVVGDTIKTTSSNRIEKVTALTKDSITYTQTDSASAQPVTRPREFFLNDWNAGKITKAGDLSAEEMRAKFTTLYGATVADAIMKRSDLAKNMKILDKSQAHHIIPVEIWGKDIMTKKLIDSGWNPNNIGNGAALAEGFHGNHPAYTTYVKKQIDLWMKGQKGITLDNLVQPFSSYVEGTLIPLLKSKIAIAKTSGKTLNDYFASL